MPPTSSARADRGPTSRDLRGLLRVSFALLLPLGPAPVVAQETGLALDLGAAYSLPPGGDEDLASAYLNGGLRLDGGFGQGGFFGLGLMGGLALESQGASWASAKGLGGWLQPLSRLLFVGVTFSGEAFTVGDPGPYRAAYAVAEPEIQLAAGGTTVRLSGYGGIGSSEVTTFETFVRDTRFGRRAYQIGFPVSSDLWSVGGGLEVAHRFGALVPRISAEAYDSPQGGYSVGRLGLEILPPGGVFYVEAAMWDTPDGDDLVFIAGLQIETGTRTSFQASGGRYGPDPLLDTAIAGGVGAGVAVKLASLGAKPGFEWEVRASQEPELVLTLRMPGAGTVECAGDFTDWVRVPLSRDADAWTVHLPIAPGAYHFGFFVDGEWYVPPEASGLTVDDWGTTQATIVVDEAGNAPGVTP